MQDQPPVVLVHGWGGSFATTWEQSGFTALLSDTGRKVIGVDLLGHGTAPKPHDPAAYADLTQRLFEAMPNEGQVDAIGFSLGALTLLRAASAAPHRFGRMVLAGIGRNVFEDDAEQTLRLADAVEAAGSGAAQPDHDQRARVFAQYAARPDNDAVALAAVLRHRPPRLTEAQLERITCPCLVTVGDADFVLPADRLVAALPDARFELLRRTDHFATPEAYGFIDATLKFLDAEFLDAELLDATPR